MVIRIPKVANIDVDRLVSFHNIIGALLPQQHVLKITIRELDKADVIALVEKSKFYRPKHRIRNQVDWIAFPETIKCIEMEDLTRPRVGYDNCIAFEIKPKWGFMPINNPYIPQNSPKRKKCRFCMHKYYKAMLKRVPKEFISVYCPMDLYSRDPIRVRKAIKALIDIPGNNLRVFMNGRAIDFSEDRFKYGDITTCFDSGKSLDAEDGFLCQICDVLVQDDILSRLAEYQSTLDSYGIDHVYKLYRKTMDNDQILLNCHLHSN